MTKELFIDKNFRGESLTMINHANTIIASYARQGYRLTLRQLYYQFVSRNLISNTERSYSKLGNLISDARLAGLIDWAAIEDRSRSLRGINSYASVQNLLALTKYWYKRDNWSNQPMRIEVWVEKEALLGVIGRIAARYEVDYFACKGYVSQSEMYDAAKRYAQYINAGQDVLLIHLGDHDPSGIDMSRDIEDRIRMFLRWNSYKFNIERIALNYDQVQQYNPPPNPAKSTDSRFESYMLNYGDTSWELDALEPSVISSLIETKILDNRDQALWDEAIEEEQEGKDQLS